jgi:hypothetical protein
MKEIKLYQECETCNFNRHDKIYSCMIRDSINYKELIPMCPCRECLFKTNCRDICQPRLDICEKIMALLI